MKVFVDRFERLCRGNPDEIHRFFTGGFSWCFFCLVVITIGSGLYGATLGLARAPLQALYTAIKFPLLIILTTVANFLFNGMLAQLLGLGISIRQSSLAVFTSFALASIILASLSPVTFFLWLNTPDFASAQAEAAHHVLLLVHICFIAFAGMTGNTALFRLLALMSGSRAIAGRILAAWLLGNMFLGCQLSWIMRPFIGSPFLPVEFFRAEAFHGNFYETTFKAAAGLLR